MKKRIFAYILALLIPLGLFAGCSEQLPLVYVQSVAELVGYSSVGSYNTCAGVVMAPEEVAISRDESRKLKSLSVEVGQYVNEGDVLFIYDTSGVQLEIDRLKLEVEQLNNTIKDLKSQITQLEKEKKSAKESDKLAYTLQIQSLQTDQSEAEYHLALKNKEIEALNSSKDTGEVKSPIDGEVKAINEDGGYDPYTGAPLPYITLSNKDVFRVKGTVNELNRDEFFVGQNVIIRSRIDSSKTWTGVITQVDMQAEENDDYFYYYGSDEMYTSSSYPFYVQPDSSEDMLLGQHVFIEPDCGQTQLDNGLHLNAAYVCGNEEDGYYVWAASKDDTIEKREITVGALDAVLNTYEILSGLTVTDRIAYPAEEIVAGASIIEVLPDDEIVEQEDYAPADDITFEDTIPAISEEEVQTQPTEQHATAGEPIDGDTIPDELIDDGGVV